MKPVKDFALLQEMRRFLQWRARDAILLAEANVPANESMHYFGDEGDRLQMMLNFPVNQRLYYAFATHDPKPLKRALRDTIANVPRDAQWVQFLRSHDELDLGRLTEEQRAKVFNVFAPDPAMQLYNRGIRRRLAPMLGNDRRRLELAYSLLFSLPGTPMIQYGDEIGMGEDLSLNEREATRTPMQWTDEPHGGFTSAKKSVLPVVDGGIFGYQKVNVNAQRRDPNSFMNWITRLIRVRKECMEISWGECEVIGLRRRPGARPGLPLQESGHGVAAQLQRRRADPAPQSARQGGRAPHRPDRLGAQPRRAPRYPRDRARRLRLPLVPDRRRRRDADPRPVLSLGSGNANCTGLREDHAEHKWQHERCSDRGQAHRDARDRALQGAFS